MSDDDERIQVRANALELSGDAHTLKLSEEQRQLVLMSLALLSIARPGFDYALHAIAVQIDNLEKEPARGTQPRRMRADLYDRFRALLESEWKRRPGGST